MLTNNNEEENVVIEVVAEDCETISKEEVMEKAENLKKDIRETIKREEELTSDEAEAINKVLGSEEVKEEESLGNMLKDVLGGFMSFIQGDDFEAKCEGKAQEYGVNSTIVKNAFIRNTLGTIANALNLTVHLTGDIIKGAVGFITTIIGNIVNFGVSTLHKLITIVTMNCGTIQY